MSDVLFLCSSFADGQIVEGVTNVNGETSLLAKDIAQGMELLRVKLGL
ncbi:hypothetical protein CupriaWKF_19335 [Cupriavidus sp. WKF15]|nr:hypothetical protein [Cupriavidus sp. WKF15]WER49309.1 hypothetical protein CupriaWKF_19335 [Cupriavidus sp. WKF15]